MPKKNKKNKKRTKPNVFVQSNANENLNQELKMIWIWNQLLKKQTKSIATNSSSSNYFSREIKKMGIISTSMIVILAILTIVLG